MQSIFIVAVLLATGSLAVAAEESFPPIERLVSLPNLSGTPPTNPTWSPDGRRVAFLWNDSGFLLRDLWVTNIDRTVPQRLTEMNPSTNEQPEFADQFATDMSIAELQQQSARRHARGISEFIWGRQGEQILFVYRGRIHKVSLQTGEISILIDTVGDKSDLAISPDGRFLAFLQGGDVWLYRFEGEYLVQATDIGEPGIGSVPIGAYNAPDREFRSLSWSPDSRYLALEYVDRRDVHRMPVPSYLHDEPIMHEVRRSYPGDEGLVRKVGIYDTADGLVRYVALEDPTRRTLITLKWSPAAPELLIEQDSYTGEHRWISVASVSDRNVRELLHDHRPRRIYSLFTSAWSSDGKRIIYIGDGDDYYRLYSMPAEGGGSRMLTRGDFDVSGNGFSASKLQVLRDIGEVFFTSSEESPYERHIYRIKESGGSTRKVTTMAGTHTEWTVSPDGSHVAVVSSNDITPGDLYIIPTGSGEPQRVTHSPLPEFDELELVEPRYVTFPSRIDDFTLHARIITPRNMDPDKKYPVIIGNVYSSTARNKWTWPRPISMVQQKQVADGNYIVVQTDLRGSTGYGVDFREAFQGDWGGGDLQDIHSTVDYLATLPNVDVDRIGIWGNSYGGMMVLFALFERPGMFAAGIAGSPAIDVSYFTQNDQHLSRRPHTHPEIFRDSTLLNYGEKLEDPLLLIHGLHDDIVPWKTTAEMVEKLMLLGKDFDMVVPPQSAHWWGYPEHYAVHTFRKIQQFFNHHVGPGGLPKSQR